MENNDLKNLYCNCCCGAFFQYANKKRHLGTNKHLKYLQENNIKEYNLYYEICFLYDLDDDLYSVITTKH